MIAELGYVPNQAARQLVTHRTGAVAVVATQPENRLFLDPFFDCLLREVRRELAAHGAQAVLLFLDETGRLRARGGLPRRRSRRRSRAVLAAARRPAARDDRPARHPRRVRRPPPAARGRHRPAPAHAYVDGDNRGGARLAVRHLLSLGRRRIATVAGPYDQENSAADRLAGYRDALPPGTPHLVERADYTRQGGADAMAALLDRHPDLDAVFAASDLMASGALQTLREHGRRVPEDVAVVGFDDLASIAGTTDPPLTTVHQDVEEMGRRMVRLLFDRTRQVRSEVVPTRLVRRRSA